MEKYSVVKEYSAYYNCEENDDNYEINGIEKIKIPEKGEFIITYSQNTIRIWKI